MERRGNEYLQHGYNIGFVNIPLMSAKAMVDLKEG